MINHSIAYQGVKGAYSEQACKNAYPHLTPIACDTFQEAMWLVEQGDVDIAMIPLENSTAGRVEEIYRLIPKMALHVIGEHFEPVVHCLIGVNGAHTDDLKYVASHPQALAQCHNNIISLGLKADAKLDTAGSAKELSESGDISRSAIASKLAAEIYGLDVLQEHFEDIQGNTTRFFVLSRKKFIPTFNKDKSYITSLIFQVRDIPSSLYKALGGFATNGVNLLKIESYMGTTTLDGSQFHIDIDGHIEARPLRLALEELAFFAEDVRVLGTYEKHRLRNN
ncbi:MAG: prephenate dehydratase [Epsilonproteobacteria bacterium]|nr:prephenate dehydratase [Campylobacterota bacterium]